jgi:SAM-dependent methyltransferase
LGRDILSQGEKVEQGQRQDVWAAGQLYEPYIGRWSRLVAREFLRDLSVPPARRWLDVGCGTGALARTILDTQDPTLVAGVDPSAGFIEFAKAAVADDRAAFEVADARALPFPPETFDAVVSGLVLNFVPQPAQAVAEMARVVRSDGVVAAYVWDYAGRMELMRHFWNAAVALDPAALELDEGRRFPVCQPQPLAQLFTQAG